MTPSPKSATPSDDDIATYQAALLDALYVGHLGLELIDDVRVLTNQAPWQETDLDPTLLEIAADLTRTWSRRPSA